MAMLIEGRLIDGYLTSTPKKCRTCNKECDTTRNYDRLDVCRYGYAHRSINESVRLVGLVVRSYNPTDAAKKAARRADREDVVSASQVDATVRKIRAVIRESEDRRTRELAAEIDEAEQRLDPTAVVDAIREDLRKNAGQLHDYKALAIQIRQNLETALGIQSLDANHVRERVNQGPTEIGAAYWASRLMEGKLASLQLLTDREFLNELPIVQSRFHGALHKYVHIFRAVAQEKDVKVFLDGESRENVTGARDAVDQTIFVLLDNAVKYSPPGRK